MKKIFALGVMIFSVLPAFCFVVKSEDLTSKYNISYAERQKNNYIEKGGYSFRYLGEGSWDVQRLSTSETAASNASFQTKHVMVIAGIVIVHLILTWAIYKMKGIGHACFYFFLAPIAFVVLLLIPILNHGYDSKEKRINIHHRWF